jgi:DNA polymerase-1
MEKKCLRCRWGNNNYVNCIPYFGSSTTGIVLMGEAFGTKECEHYVETGIAEPFIGSAGKNLDKLLAIAGLRRENCILMNAIRCWQPNNPLPTKKELDACFIFSLLELKKIKPKLVIALGASALYQCLGYEKVEKLHGCVYFSDKIGFNVAVTFHPAAALYDRSKWKLLEEDFYMIRSEIDATTSTKRATYTLVQDPEQFRKLVPKLLDKELAIDVEATDLDAYSNRLTLLQIGLAEEEIYLIDPKIFSDIMPDLREVLSRAKLIGQAFAFDVKQFLQHFGVFPESWLFDTCLAEYTLSGVKDNDLTTLTALYAPEYFGYDAEVNRLGGAHNVKDFKQLCEYGANDTAVLFPIRRKQYKQMVKRNVLNLYESIILPANKILTKMSVRGVEYDIPYLMNIDSKWKGEGEKALNEVRELESVKKCEEHFNQSFNPRSYEMVKWLLIDYYRLPVLKETKKGNASIGKEEMKRYTEDFDNEYCLAMEKYRSIQNVRDNFLSGALPKLVDGVAHTTYSLHATSSGRPNSRDPNLLNIPRNKEIKRCIKARDGYLFVASDEGQLEVRLSAVIYNEPRLIDICNDLEKDIHSNITATAFNYKYEEVYENYKKGDTFFTELRVKGKGVQFGTIYQIGARKLAYQLKISEEDAANFISEYYERFPDLRKNIDRTIDEIMRQRYVDNYFLFRRSWPNVDMKDDGAVQKMQREGINHKIQSLGWNFLELAMIQIDEQFRHFNLDAHLVMQVYDSVIVEVKKEQVNDAAKIVKEIMENVNQPYENVNRVRFKSDVECGINLADTEKIV